jgi:hypothetical protein
LLAFRIPNHWTIYALGIEEAKGAPGYLSKGHAKTSVPAWVDGPVSGSAKPIGNPKTMAQVHPQLFTQAIFAKAVEKYGVSLVIGKVQEVKLAGNKVTGVVVDGEVIAADTAVVAMGPWSGENSLVSSLTSISGLKAHSIVVRPKQPDAISPYALFLTYVSYLLFWFCTLTMVSNLCQKFSLFSGCCTGVTSSSAPFCK